MPPQPRTEPVFCSRYRLVGYTQRRRRKCAAKRHSSKSVGPGDCSTVGRHRLRIELVRTCLDRSCCLGGFSNWQSRLNESDERAAERVAAGGCEFEVNSVGGGTGGELLLGTRGRAAAAREQSENHCRSSQLARHNITPLYRRVYETRWLHNATVQRPDCARTPSWEATSALRNSLVRERLLHAQLQRSAHGLTEGIRLIDPQGVSSVLDHC